IFIPFLVQLWLVLFLAIQKYNSQEILVRLTTLSLFSITYFNRLYYLHYSMWFMALLFVSYSKEFKIPTIILHLAWFLEIIAWGLPISLLRTILTYTYYLMIQVVSPILIYLLYAEKPYNLLTKLKLSKLLLIK
uniref:hypothetical protein n=1 Tax=Candidatus Borrarchaeum sp. TaxID=2846742 RepID=UPI00257A47D4